MSQTEKNLLSYINQIFEKSKKQLNKIDESDAEIISLDQGDYAINIDSYSPDEDFFSDLIPENLGHNLVIATISDLLATGATPEFFLHAMVLQKNKNHFYNEKVLNGIHQALLENNTFLLGGDTSIDTKWRYTGVAIGKTERKLKRSGAKKNDIIYSTGKFGTGNRAALIQMLLEQNKLEKTESNVDLACPKFKSRLKESKIISKYANCAMDSSDGLINTIKTIFANNAHLGMEIDLTSDLIEEESKYIAMIAKLPEIITLFATLGEYELIFTISESQNELFLKEMKDVALDVIQLGKVTDSKEIIINHKDKSFSLDDQMPDPRGMETKNYIAAITEYVMKIIQ